VPPLPSHVPPPHRPSPQVPALEYRLVILPSLNFPHQSLPIIPVRQPRQLRSYGHDHGTRFGQQAEGLVLAADVKVGGKQIAYVSGEEVYGALNEEGCGEGFGGESLDECGGAGEELCGCLNGIQDIREVCEAQSVQSNKKEAG
jgi:hypothetical protein